MRSSPVTGSFRYALSRSEESRDKIAIEAGGGGDIPEPVDRRKLVHVRPQLPHLILVLKHAQTVGRAQHLRWLRTQGNY